MKVVVLPWWALLTIKCMLPELTGDWVKNAFVEVAHISVAQKSLNCPLEMPSV